MPILTSSAVRSPMSRLYSFLMKLMMASSIFWPPTRTEREMTTPFMDSTAISDVPPPMSTTIEPLASSTGRPAPMAAAMGSSTRCTLRAPALRTTCSTA